MARGTARATEYPSPGSFALRESSRLAGKALLAGKDAPDLGGRFRRRGPRVAQPLADGGQQAGAVTSFLSSQQGIAGLYFDLAPDERLAPRRAQPLGGYLVVGDLGEHHAGLTDQATHGPFCLEACYGDQRAACGELLDPGGQPVRDLRTAQRLVQLAAGIGADRQLEMPARVGTAGAAAQRPLWAPQRGVLGVVVEGVEVVHLRVGLLGHTGQVG